ncbi:sorting nexin [Quaeritorhiza haematococci]|nr:sorting nexin [Quaeritorhiza haematococci]
MPVPTFGSAVESSAKRRRLLHPKPMLDEDSLFTAFSENNINKKHAHKLWRYLIQQNAQSHKDVPELPKPAISLLDSEFVPLTSRVIKRTDAADGSTTKLLVELQDGQQIESVIMRYGHVELDCFPEEEKRKRVKTNEQTGEKKFRSNKRATLCVSSQVGCSMGCTFCATGTMGLLSNLTAGEILEQLVHANKIEKIRGVVFMGMGEPLDNYSAVLAAIRGMVDTGRFGLSPSRISISTVGVIPRIHSLIQDAPDVGLALSLHAPTQTLRTEIVPTAKAWPLERILAATDAFIANQNQMLGLPPANPNSTTSPAVTHTEDPMTSVTRKNRNRRRHVLVEYVLIRSVNDSETVAHQLGALLRGRDVLLNVIPYNPTSVPHDYKTPEREVQARFVDIVRNEYGVHTLLRQTLGQDVSAACGQLVIDTAVAAKAKKATEVETVNGNVSSCAETKTNQSTGGVADLEDLMSGSSAGRRWITPQTSARKRRVGGGTSVDDVEEEVVDQQQSSTKANSGATTPFSQLDRSTALFIYVVVALLAVLLARLVWKVYASTSSPPS